MKGTLEDFINMKKRGHGAKDHPMTEEMEYDLSDMDKKKKGNIGEDEERMEPEEESGPSGFEEFLKKRMHGGDGGGLAIFIKSMGTKE